MIFNEPKPFEEAIESRQVKSILPTEASTTQLRKIAPEIRERAVFSARVTNAKFLEDVDQTITQIVSPETVIDPTTGARRPAQPGEYMDTATARLKLKESLQAIGYQPDPDKRGGLQDLSSDRRLDLIIDTNTKMAQGYGYWSQGQESSILDQFPAQELFRGEQRDEKRDWLSRWQGAGGKLYGGKMIAKKNASIWTQISAFGLPYPPFDFNSGMDVRDINHDEAVKLGVITPEEMIVPESRDFNEDLSVSAPARQTALFDALTKSLGDAAEFANGVLRLKG